MNGYLAHYGVKGMKWGIRRYQNKDRTLTAAGKQHDYVLRKTRNAMKTTKDANDIASTLTPKEKELLGASKNEPWINPEYERESSSNIAKRIVVSDKAGKPASFMEIWDDGGKTGQIAIATKSGEEYRGKGYASEAVKRGKDWFDRYGHKHLDSMEWIAKKENAASINLAKKHGFEEVAMKDVHPEWVEGYSSTYTILQYKKNGKDAVRKVLG